MTDRAIIGTVTAVHPAKRRIRIEVAREPEKFLEDGAWLHLRLADGECMRCKLVECDYDEGEATLTFVPGVTRDNVARMKQAQVLSPLTTEDTKADLAIDASQLIGFAVENQEGTPIGTVAGALETKSSWVVEIESQGGGSFLLPVIEEAVENIDLDGERVRVRDLAPYAVATGGYERA